MGRKNIKEKRKKQLRRRIILFCLAVFCLIFGIVSIIKTKKNSVDENVSEDAEMSEDVGGTPVDEVALAKEEAEALGLPAPIIELLDKNPETLEFVKQYNELKDDPPAEIVEEVGEKGEIPHLLQWDSRWGYQPYGDGFVSTSGCGPTCMSMIVVGLTGDAAATPYKISQHAVETGYAVEGGGTYARYMVEGAEVWNLSAEESLESEEFVRDALAQGKPVVCNLAPGKYFTNVGHFIVITEYEEGVLTVRDPFSIENTEKTWKYSDIQEQIVGLYSYSVK